MKLKYSHKSAMMYLSIYSVMMSLNIQKYTKYSPNRMSPCCVRRMFPALRSLWMILWECKYWSPCRVCRQTTRIWFSDSPWPSSAYFGDLNRDDHIDWYSNLTSSHNTTFKCSKYCLHTDLSWQHQVLLQHRTPPWSEKNRNHNCQFYMLLLTIVFLYWYVQNSGSPLHLFICL